jgi:hypothetical protein
MIDVEPQEAHALAAPQLHRKARLLVSVSNPAIAILPGTSRQRRERACCRFDKRANTLK